MKEQAKRVLEHLKKNGSITTLDALQAYGITRLSARIWELRHEEGYTIKSESTKVRTRYGETIVAKYKLEGRAKK